MLEFLDLALLGARSSAGEVNLLNYSAATGGSITKLLDFMEPICESNGTLWPGHMSNNTGESIASVLPECRLLFHRAALAFPTRKERYIGVSQASGTLSSGPYTYWTLGLTMVEYVELMFTA